MAILSPSRAVNPRLGSYFGIFLSGFAAIALTSLILQGLGVELSILSLAMLLGPIALYAGIGIATHASDPLDFFAAGRRVPAFFNGLVLAMSAFGATGLVALTGLFFLIGYDALFIGIGALGGFVVMAVLLAPFLRKFGAFTIPSYLGRRFDSRPLRLATALVVAIPIVMILSAELRFAAEAAIVLTGWSHGQAFLVLYLVLLVTLVPGGMRSMTWTGVAQSLAAFFAVMVPVIIVAAIVTTMPVPQLTHGPVLRAIGRNEAIQGLPIILPPGMAFDLPGPELQPILKRFADPFGALGPAAFVLGTLSMIAGVASAPWLLPRLAAAPGVYEARKTLGWATFIFGFAMLTAASVAVFMRDYLMDLIVTPGPAVVPPWLAELAKRGFASITETGTQFTASSISFARDSVLLSLPVAAQLPPMLLDLSLAAIIAGALVAAGAATTALGHILSEDILFGGTWDAPHGPVRIHAGRGGIAVAAAVGRARCCLRDDRPAPRRFMRIGDLRIGFIPRSGAFDLVEADERLWRYGRHADRLPGGSSDHCRRAGRKRGNTQCFGGHHWHSRRRCQRYLPSRWQPRRPPGMFCKLCATFAFPAARFSTIAKCGRSASRSNGNSAEISPNCLGFPVASLERTSY